MSYLKETNLVFTGLKMHLNAAIDFSALYEAFMAYLILSLALLLEIRSELLCHREQTVYNI